MAKGVKRIEKEKDILKLTIEKSKAHLEELEEKLELMKVTLGRMLEVGWWKRLSGFVRNTGRITWTNHMQIQLSSHEPVCRLVPG